jgi:hypothetical protein
MKWNLNPISFLERRSEQAELKNVFIKELVDDFENNFLHVIKSNLDDSKGLYYKGMKAIELVKLKELATELHGDTKRILERFPVSPEIKEILEKIKQISIDLTHEKSSEEFIKKFNEGKIKDDERFDVNLSTDFIQKIQILWGEIYKLKNINSFLATSTKIKTSK